MTDPADCVVPAAAVFNKYGRLDVQVNNAGVTHSAPATREQPEEFRAVVAVDGEIKRFPPGNADKLSLPSEASPGTVMSGICRLLRLEASAKRATLVYVSGKRGRSLGEKSNG